MKVIDGWVNVKMPKPAAWQLQAAKAFKRSPEEVFGQRSPEEIVAMMDAAGVEKALITLPLHVGRPPDADVLAFCEKHPERFGLRLLVDPRRGMAVVHAVAALARAQPVKVVGLIPCMLDLPPNDKAYYPLYAKCCELGMPVSVNTGIPGPPLPGRCQDPLHLDEVCLFFPELTIVMANGADPWWAMAMRLMLKYRNLHLMTSAFAPKYLPAELVAFMNKRGSTKVIFGTDFPFLTMERCIAEARALALDESALQSYLYGNAERVFFAAPQDEAS